MRIAPSIDADAVVLKVETSGVGIPTKKAERIFDEILAGPQGTQRLVPSSRRAVQTGVANSRGGDGSPANRETANFCTLLRDRDEVAETCGHIVSAR